MKRFALLSVMGLLIALPALAGHGEKCTMDAQSCLNSHAAMKGMGWTGLDLDKSDATAIKVKAVAAGTPASKAGFKVGDVLVAINGASVADKDALKKAKGEWKVGQAVTYTVKRGSAEKQLSVTLAQMPDDVYASMIGAHMLENHVTANTAAAPETQATPATAAETKTDK